MNEQEIDQNQNQNDILLAKQKYIKENILDKNYDRNKFLSYCLNQKPDNGHDLNFWSMNELINVVNSFIQDQNNLQNEINTQIHLDIGQSKNDNENNNNQNNNNNLNIQEINCKTLNKTYFNDKHLTIEMKNPNSIETNYFSQNYVLYTLETTIIEENKKFIVQRRYNDFLWIREILTKNFPRIFVPPLPGKKMGNRRFENDFILKRMKNLNIFLNKIIINETFKTSNELFSFLTVVDRGQFEDYKKLCEGDTYIPVNVEEVRTIDGKLKISLDLEREEKYFININKYLEIQNKIYERLNDDLKSFHKCMNEAVENLAGVQKDFQLLHLLNSKVSMKMEILKTFEEFGIFFKNWKRVLFNQNDIFKQNIKKFFKYVNMENNSYFELVKSREEIKKKYLSENLKLIEKKEKLWSELDINKWEISDYNNLDRALLYRDKNYAFSKMCTFETFTMNNLRKMLGYANRTTMDELKKLINQNKVGFLENLRTFSEKLSPTLTDSLNVWTRMVADLNDLNVLKNGDNN